MFTHSKLPLPRGTGLCTNVKDLAQQIGLLYAECTPARVVVKLNQSFSGEGNAILDLTDLTSDSDLTQQILERLTNEL